MKYISIDIETTGLDPEKHQILEFAAVFDDLEQPKRLENLPTFHRLIRWDDYVINNFCLNLHKELLQEIRDRNRVVIPIDTLAGEFRAWLHGMVGNNYNVAGKNFAGFDGQFLKKIPDFPVWHHRVIDVGSMYLTKDMDTLPSLGDIDRLHSVEHRALPDALAVVAAIRNKMIGE